MLLFLGCFFKEGMLHKQAFVLFITNMKKKLRLDRILNVVSRNEVFIRKILSWSCREATLKKGDPTCRNVKPLSLL